MIGQPPTSPSPPDEFRDGLYAYLARHTPDHVEVIDRDYRVRYLNHPAPGTTIEDVLGMSLLDLSPPEIAKLVKRKMDQVFAEAKTVTWEGMFDSPAGRRYYNTVVGPIIKDGEVIAATLIARDVTDLVSLQIKHTTASRLATIGELAAGVGHEINNPLMSLTGHLLSVQDALDDAGVTDKSVHDKLRECEDSVARIARIVRGLRRFSRSGSKDEAFDLHRSIEETVEFLSSIFGFRSLSFEFDFGVANIQCQGDSAIFQQALTNLLINAKDATHDVEHPVVQIRTRLQSGRATIQVEDNGPGVAERTLPYIFDPFFSTKGEETSRGMGLTVARSLLQSMDGSLEATNADSGGALFTISLPGKQVLQKTDLNEASWIARKLERGRVLLVDDDESVLDAISFLLEDLGFQVSSRTNPLDALQVVEQDSFDIVISDRQMPGMSGEVFVQQAQARISRDENRPQPRYFLLSGWHDPDQTESTIRLGDVDIGLIGKPVTRAQLADHLATSPLLGDHRSDKRARDASL